MLAAFTHPICVLAPNILWLTHHTSSTSRGTHSLLLKTSRTSPRDAPALESVAQVRAPTHHAQRSLSQAETHVVSLLRANARCLPSPNTRLWRGLLSSEYGSVRQVVARLPAMHPPILDPDSFSNWTKVDYVLNESYWGRTPVPWSKFMKIRWFHG